MSYSNWRPLGYVKAVGGEGQIVTQVFDAPNFLRIYFRSAGLGLAAIPELRFNFDASTVNYASRVSSNFAAPTATVAGTATGIRITDSSNLNTKGLIVFDVQNFPGRTHGVTWVGSENSEAAATAPNIVVGSGIFASTGTILWVIMAVTGTGFIANTDLAVFGHD